MPAKYKVLILDDEPDLLELYRDVLKTLPCQPEVHTCDSGTRAMAILESEPFNLLISDLNMPRMDGLQVLAIVRKKFPELKVVVMTAVMEDQYRTRAYALGVDLFWQKPITEQETKLFMDSMESLLTQEVRGGFRGIQSKSMVDIIQLECMSQNSSVLKITNAMLEGRIWIQTGEIIDAAVGDMQGEAAFKKIVSWKSGSFEVMHEEPTRTRTIFNSYQGLLLDTAQAMDENIADENAAASGKEQPADAIPRQTPLLTSSKVDGVDFVLVISPENHKPIEAWGLGNAEPMTQWTLNTWKKFQELGEQCIAGQIKTVEGRGQHHNVTLVQAGDKQLCIGMQRNLAADQCQETAKNVLTKWVS
jgi:CheY-like chemotaxis protein